jgi:hypothetical protein
MTNEDDDFWTTYIATTPEQDQDFAGCGGCFTIAALLAVALFVWLRFF